MTEEQKKEPVQKVETASNVSTEQEQKTTKPGKSKQKPWVLIIVIIFFLGLSAWQSYRTYFEEPARKEIDQTIANQIDSSTSTPPVASTDPAPNQSGNDIDSTAGSKTPKATPAQRPQATPDTTPPPAPAQQPSSPTYQTTFTKQEQIDFFVRVALKDDSNSGKVYPVIKWTKNPVLVRIEGPGNDADYACANETISLINGISNSVKLSRTEGAADTVVHFVTKAEVEAAGHSGYGYMTFSYNSPSNLSLKKTDAYIAYNANEDSYRCRTIRHEMTHTLGLFANAGKFDGGYDYSIFNVNAGQTEYLEIDKAAIRIMYNTAVAPGWTESQVRNYLAGAEW